MLLLSLVTLVCSLCALSGVRAAATPSFSSDYGRSLVRRNSTGLTNAVTWDPHSLSIQGQRVFILSAEYHHWRLPNPNLWSDVFQKIRANGYNTVSFYVHWGLLYPTPDTNGGQGDYQAGTYREVQRFIDEAKAAGLWLIARPGPYINAETTGGGMPGWVGNIAGSVRTDNVNFTDAWTPYMTGVAKLIARNQITNGGPIILVQAENEFSAGGSHNAYMQAIEDLYRANGIVVPITENDQHGGATGNFSPDLPGTAQVNIYCGDSYPQSDRWAQVQAVYYSDHEAVAWSNPLCLAEFGGGWLMGWNSTTMGGTGYEVYTTDLSGPAYEDIFYKENYAQTATIQNIYMTFGGTNWGQTAEPTVYTSYDYGAGINENRVATPKMNEMRMQGLFLRVSRDLLGATLIANGTNYTTSSLIHTAELHNLDTGAGFYVIRHDTSTSTALTTTQLNVSTSAGQLLIPKTGDITLNGRESKILVTDYVFGQSKTRMLYTTTEVMTWTTIDSKDYIVLYALAGQTGETVFTFPSAPRVDTSNAKGVNATVSGNTVTLGYTTGTPAYVSITSSGKTVVAVLMSKENALNWHAPVIAASGTFGNYFSLGTNETVLVNGPYLVRTASLAGPLLSLTGDVNGTTTVEAIAPSDVLVVTWNGELQLPKRTAYGSLQFTVKGAGSVKLPSLNSLKWKVSGSLPEVSPNFDDSSFTSATLTTTNYTNLPPLSAGPILYAQQYGFYGGNLIFRGHFTASGAETAVNLTVQGGFAFGYSAFLNGVFLGSSQGSPTVSVTTSVWQIPSGTLQVKKDNVLTVIQDNMGLVEASTNSGKEPRGIRGATIIGGNTTFSSWKLQGNQGGAAHAPDTFRGYLNEGGLYAERIGAHLPDYPDLLWPQGTPLTGGGVKGAGVNFYRTTFDLDLPLNSDVPVRLSITPSDMSSNFRVQIYINGWQVGKYINNFGPQTDFVLPAGILRRNGLNTLALSLWSLDSTGASIAGLELITDGVFGSALEIEDYVTPPDYLAQIFSRPLGTVQKAM